jgi:hypothetical protein
VASVSGERSVNSTRLAWEPETDLSPLALEQVVRQLVDGDDRVSVLRNGTLLFVNPAADNVAFANSVLSELDTLYNFQVVTMRFGGYLVEFHEAVAVYVGEQEFVDRREEILNRMPELVFAGEKFDMPADAPADHALIGIYARGKLKRDIHHFSFVRRI